VITSIKSHIGFQMTQKSLTLDKLEGLYCNRNYIGCSVSFLSTAGLSCIMLCANEMDEMAITNLN